MRTLLVMTLVLAVVSKAPAQYAWFEGNNLNSVAFTSSLNGTAVGGGLNPSNRFGIIMKTTDGGEHWNIQTKTDALYEVSFADLNTGTAVGGNGAILRTTDGGEQWTPQASGTNEHLYGVSLIDANIGIAVGAHGTIRKTTNGGSNWVGKPSGTTNDLEAVSFVNSTTGTAVGGNGTILRTTDGGETWVTQTKGTTSWLLGVAFANADSGIAVGLFGTMLKTTNGGLTWIPQNIETNEWLFGIACAGANDWTAVGTFGTILRTTDGGINWNLQQSNTTNHLVGASLADANNVTAVGLFGTIVRTTNGGSTWANQFSTQVGSHRFDYNGTPREYFVFLPQNYSEYGSFPLMIGLHGTGGNGLSFLDFSRMSSVADTGGFIVVYPSPIGGLWDLSNDVGFISALIDTIATNYSVNLLRVYACGFSRGGYMTHELGCQLSHRLAAIAPVAGTILSSTISTCNASASVPVFYLHGTLDPTVSYSGVPQTLNFWIDRNDAGHSIDSVALPDIDTTDGSTVVKYSFRNSGGEAKVVFYKVIDGGHQWPGSWNTVSTGGNKNMDINTSSEIWDFVKDFRMTGINDGLNILPASFSLFQNYPNPFNPSTTIRYSLPKAGHVTLQVYDLLGREVATLVNEKKHAGNYEVPFNASLLSSGVYVYRLSVAGTAGNFSASNKMILIK